jgi:hypothetical protein
VAIATNDQLVGAVLLAPVRTAAGVLAKGTRLQASHASTLREAAARGQLATLRLAWADPDEVHEDDAACRLARSVAGPGVTMSAPRQSRIDLAARWPGVLKVRVEPLGRLNRLDPLEVFTLFHGQAVVAGQVVAAVKVAPHLVEERVVQAGEAVAAESGPLVDVAPYRPLDASAIAAEALSPEALDRFDSAARTKITGLGGRFGGTTVVSEEDPAAAEVALRRTLARLLEDGKVSLILVGGVSAGDPLSPFYAALDALGGRVWRRGVPAHPGSMIWLAELGRCRLLGLPQCGMFSMATAADLVLAWLMTGEPLDHAALGELGHGGLLGPEMRFRLPAYARDLETPE